MAIVTGDRYLEKLVRFVEEQVGPLIEGSLVLKLNPAGLHYVQSRIEALHELESLLTGAPVDYLRAYVSDLGDHRALEQLRRILRLLTSLKVVSVLPQTFRDPTPLSFLPFGRLKVLELRGCDLSTSAAKGLLELRHTLEKIICHNSTNALRHVFASRIAEIKDSPPWNRLSFVSCACNGLVLMDESLQLLPSVETLDLSRNKFAKVDNLRRCSKLKHLDLGFNHLRTISSFSEVSCQIVKVVLRNNALTTLRGIEKLKSLEGLDVSYNIISNFSELEYLAGLPSLQNLWLEGNPLCCARWYREQVFSFLTFPENLKLDDKHISSREFWKMQIIIARKHKKPASFGFYSPAKDTAVGEGSVNRRVKKVSRLASIESDEDSTYVGSDQESVSCDNEVQNREDPVVSDDEAEIVDLINKVEVMKKERSVLWLREFKEWMDHAPKNFVDNSRDSGALLHPRKENTVKNKPSHAHPGESSRYVSDSVLASGDESSTNILESDNSFVDMSSGFHTQQYFSLGSVDSMGAYGTMDQEHLKSCSQERIGSALMQAKLSSSETFTTQGSRGMAENVSPSPLTSVDDISESHSSSAWPSSPPHYQQDLLHRRQNLVEEILQLSADSYSLASSDSNTSCSEMDYSEFEPSRPEPELDHSRSKNFLNGSVEVQLSPNVFEDKICDQGREIPHVKENGIYGFASSANQTFKLWGHDFPAVADDGRVSYFDNHDPNLMETKKSKKKAKRRDISLLQESIIDSKTVASHDSDNNLSVFGRAIKQEQRKQVYCGDDLQEVIDERHRWTNAMRKPEIDDVERFSGDCLTAGSDDFIVKYFNVNVADSRSDETCTWYMECNCLVQSECIYREREVAVLLSSHKKLYVLLISFAEGRSGSIFSLLGCHKVEEVCELHVGFGLQVVRVNIECGEAYLFITRSIEKSRQLLYTLQVFDTHGVNYACPLRSLEQVQVELFERQICGGSKVSIFQFAMVHFYQNNSDEESWLSRSLFVIGGYVLVCVEDLMQFSFFSADAYLPPYFTLDSCCNISDITEMVIDRKSEDVTLALKCLSEFHASTIADFKTVSERTASGSLKWKLKWISQESLLKFVALIKAIHAGAAISPLVVRCTS
ncbi:Outer arm dynein light chain 1 [Quillaja saponaria]|uniref:Outer arm dynein light chain 1 n=1 Tax=Quillaja saponaria TaxID=32244 RepID=A0AAD7Q5K8_QUISA|nr:Outer arm dynein light chain 1 [Quillaja saponaria]